MIVVNSFFCTHCCHFGAHAEHHPTTHHKKKRRWHRRRLKRLKRSRRCCSNFAKALARRGRIIETISATLVVVSAAAKQYTTEGIVTMLCD